MKNTIVFTDEHAEMMQKMMNYVHEIRHLRKKYRSSSIELDEKDGLAHIGHLFLYVIQNQSETEAS